MLNTMECAMVEDIEKEIALKEYQGHNKHLQVIRDQDHGHMVLVMGIYAGDDYIDTIYLTPEVALDDMDELEDYAREVSQQMDVDTNMDYETFEGLEIIEI